MMQKSIVIDNFRFSDLGMILDSSLDITEDMEINIQSAVARKDECYVYINVNSVTICRFRVNKANLKINNEILDT